MLDYVSVSAPWLIGLLWSCIPSPPESLSLERSYGYRLYAAGVFSGLAYGALALQLFLMSLGLHLLVLICTAVVALGSFKALSSLSVNLNCVVPPSRGTNRPRVLAVYVLSIIAVCIVAYQLSLSRLTPMQSWDALDWWGFQATGFLKHMDAPGPHVMLDHYWSRHPPTVSLLLAWVASISPSSHALPWMLTFVSGAMVLGGFLMLLGLPTAWALIIAVIYLSQPLIENHAVLGSYPDVLLVTSLMVVVTALSANRLVTTRDRVLWAFLAFGLASATRNTGITLALLPFASFFILRSFTRWFGPVIAIRRKRFILGALVTTAIIIGVALVSVGLGGYHEVQEFEFSGKSLSFVSFEPAVIYKNFTDTLAYNSSYGLSVVILPISIISLLSFSDLRVTANVRAASDLGMLCGISTLLLLFLLAVWQTTDHGRMFSGRGMDTGLSRYMLPISGWVLLCLGSALIIATRPVREQAARNIALAGTR